MHKLLLLLLFASIGRVPFQLTVFWNGYFCVPIEGEADVAMQVNAVTAGMASKRPVEMDQGTLAAQARDTWHSIQDGDSCRVLPIKDATLLELKPKWLHMRTVHEVFTT